MRTWYIYFDYCVFNLFKLFKLYKEKENLVTLAEHDQDSEFQQLAEQLESQNEENINTAIMNSIHKAGKHMEDHLIAAYSALLIGHIMQDNVDVMNQIRRKMKDNSFKYMALIIRKFLVFMKIMVSRNWAKIRGCGFFC